MEIVNVTLNPNDNSGMNLADGNMSFVQGGTSGVRAVRATLGKTSGKWYWEIDGSAYTGIGITNKNFPINSNNISGTSGDALNMRMVNIGARRKYPENEEYGSRNGTLVGVALDLDNGTLEFFVNGESQGYSHTNLLGLGEVFPTFKVLGYQISSKVYVNFGATPFKYSIPHGFYSYDGRQSSWYNKFLISSEDKCHSIIKSGKFSITASSTNVNYSLDSLVDNNTSADNFWSTPQNITSAWILFEHSSPTLIQKYTIHSRTSYPNSAPKDWTFEGSNDGVNWTILDTQTNQTNWSSVEYKNYYQINNSSYYKKYKFNITQNNGDKYLQISELVFDKKVAGTLLEVEKQEAMFVKFGIDKRTEIGLDDDFIEKAFVVQAPHLVGSGKVFRQKIDTTKVPIKKVTIE